MDFALYLWEQTKYSHATNGFCEKAYLLIVNENRYIKSSYLRRKVVDRT